MDKIREVLSAVLQAGNPITVREVFYQLVSGGFIAKTEATSLLTLIRHLKAAFRVRE
jgi:hypothetical protein